MAFRTPGNITGTGKQTWEYYLYHLSPCNISHGTEVSRSGGTVLALHIARDLSVLPRNQVFKMLMPEEEEA